MDNPGANQIFGRYPEEDNGVEVASVEDDMQ
jgi:hypothetical protein